MTGTRPLERLAGARIVRSFVGTEPTPGILDAIARRRASGVGLYRALNVESPAQVARLTASLQAARPSGDPPLLIALDQEGGQLQALASGATAWPGNLAIGATRSTDLARRAGEAIGRELAAVGVNVVWSPVCDLLAEANVVMGTRPFGDDPDDAGALAAAMVEGIQSAGVAATIKHLPGHGAARGDSHHTLPVVDADLAALRTRELVPFRRAIAAGPKLAMLGHLAVPAVVGDRSTPATFSRATAVGLLRDELGFQGVSVSDALNMGALGPLADAPDHAVRAAQAGLDLLLLLHEPALEDAATDAVLEAIVSGRIERSDAAAAAARVDALRHWVGERAAVREPADLSTLGSGEHVALAAEIAQRSITLVRDAAEVLPLGRRHDAVLVLAPRPTDLTPADTTSYLEFRLAAALRERGVPADAAEIPLDPDRDTVAAVVGSAAGRSVVVGTVDAGSHPGQAALVRRLFGTAASVVTIALRTPFDLLSYPEAPTYVCSYGIQPPTIEALADALTGRIPFQGRLPVRLPLAETAT